MSEKIGEITIRHVERNDGRIGYYIASEREDEICFDSYCSKTDNVPLLLYAAMVEYGIIDNSESIGDWFK